MTTTINQGQYGNAAYSDFIFVDADPNGTLAGVAQDRAFDTSQNVLYFCHTSGSAATAVWLPVIGNIPSYIG